ncbi:cellulose biosynthesis protein BcsC [Mixta theicola]|uniref:Cellulose biosynthesis protein BcsC n=1 Tax=Mixta theicola TaxID=1458355 RepID=A0A2K1Q9J7_9GAMM|nr:cellulose synthase complex outer membrane protein BcsC [Mixta theicola]PNS11718.1 cellulose biosynthesis protein BcsC [Mixta theicola]GLR07630.1 cellulose biosynthesis protein BcsC [Mixta theicola]
MRNVRLSCLSLLLPGVIGISGLPALAAEAAREVSPVEWLLEQVRTGEATNKYDLVTQALYRLDKIDPDNPEVIAARLRLALHQGDQIKAQRYMAQLKQIAPDSQAAKEAQSSMLLISPEGRQRLQQARLLATSGHLPEARVAWDRLFNGIFPDVDLALEYWSLVARIDGQRPVALANLQALDRRYPGNVGVRMQLARLQYRNDNPAQATDELKTLAENPAGRDQAAALWLSHIQAQPVTPQSVAQLQQYLATFTSGNARSNGEQELARQQKMLADPAFQLRSRGLALVDKGAGAEAIPVLQAALKLNPNDADLLGAMGQAQMRANNRAAAAGYFEQALKAGQQSSSVDKWQSLAQTNRYWLAIENGDKALAQGDIAGAERQYQQARTLDTTDSYALIGLGDVALARKNDAEAERLFRQAWQMDRTNSTAVRRLAGLYQQQSPQKAIAFINGLSGEQQRALGSTLNSLRGDVLRAEADTLAQQGSWAQAAEKYRAAQQNAPDDVWLNYRLANALLNAGEPQQADSLMAAMAQRLPTDPGQVYAHSLYLSGSDRDEEALIQLNSLPQARWDQNMHELAGRLQQDKVYAQADAQRLAGNNSAAVALLNGLPASPRRDITLADWALADGYPQQALAGYQRLLEQDKNNQDAALGQIEALVALNRKAEARNALNALPAGAAEASINVGRRLANAWQSVDDAARARQLYQQLKPRAQQETPSQSSALVFRDAARLEAQQQPELALLDYRQAMVASGITLAPPQDNPSFTRLMRNNQGDDWLKRGIRSDAADLYQRQDTTLKLEQDYSRNKGTGGISDFTAHTTMLQLETPLAAGKSFVRVDRVEVSAGTFSSENGRHTEVFGTCADNGTAGCSSDLKQRAEGVALGAGWQNDRWSADIGTSPMGFEVVNWVGGVSWNTDVKDVGLTFTASRRPISSSLLAYAGARDPSPQGGKRWGGVVATGGSVGLSYDRGGSHGVWADLSAHQISGKNVADNSRERLMAGYYYKLINEDNRRATIGLNGMLWHYQKDLSDYAFGQGGYYSPQRYFSLAVPLTWRQRTENWSFDVGGSVSWSRSKTRSQQRYPVYPGFVTTANDTAAGSSGSGFGYTLRAAVERRLTAHWTLGLAVDIQQAKDYTPSHGLIYARYSLGDWEGDLDLPPQPLTPYADFK